MLGNKELLNREYNVTIIGAPAADKYDFDITHSRVNKLLQDEIIAKGGAIIPHHAGQPRGGTEYKGHSI